MLLWVHSLKCTCTKLSQHRPHQCTCLAGGSGAEVLICSVLPGRSSSSLVQKLLLLLLEAALQSRIWGDRSALKTSKTNVRVKEVSPATH